jgi:DNA-binding NtrC family response regulator
MKTILIVDDEKPIRDIYRKTLMASCSSLFNILEAGNAWDAAQLMITKKVDLILLDIRMQGRGGEKLYEVIRKYDMNIKIIVISVYPIEQQREMIPEAYDYHDKSQGFLILMEKILRSFDGQENTKTDAESVV